MNDIYPNGPASVPSDLTRPARTYKLHAYLAVLGLFVFLALYFGLASWLTWTAYRLLSNISQMPEPLWAIFGGSCAAFLALFMFKSIIFVRRGKHEGFEVTREAAPTLFGFLDRLADEARAPRAHRVFLSPRVNAAVFYDLSLANLVFRSRKNLEIGLGLVNVLTLGEIKAVLAHEFGHFAQRSMAVGRWVYIAQQIAGHVVATRGVLDRFLQGLSNFDLRLAWIGWILRLIVWSIRSLVDTVFGWVVLAQRALSREMELQADLVAVALTGSDSLIHALHRLDAADDAMDRAFDQAAREAGAERGVRDLFAVQSHMLERTRTILDDPTHGKVPPLPTEPASHRLFRARLAHPPRMWATHPPNEVRENNAKRIYVAAPLDDRSGWVLFDDPQSLREQVTASLYETMETPPDVVPIVQTLAEIDERLDRRYLDPAYRGVYLGRSIARYARTPDEMRGGNVAFDHLKAALEDLYPASISADVEASRELSAETTVLEALTLGVLSAPGGIVNYRGQEFRRRELPSLVSEVKRDLDQVNERLAAHDRRVRSVHLSAAQSLSPSWVDYLKGLAALIHYAEHRQADLDDAMASLDNVFEVVTADQKVTDGEVERLVGEAQTLYGVLADLHYQAQHIAIGPILASRLEIESWHASLGALELPPPSAEHIGEWLQAVTSWATDASRQLSALSSAALDELLRAEEEVALALRSGSALSEAPPAPSIGARYEPLLPGQERPKQTRLGWWDRFQTADGLLPGIARFAVAATLLGCVVWAGRTSGETRIVVTNGLARPVMLDIGGHDVRVPPLARTEVVVEPGSIAIQAHTTSGERIESFVAEVEDEYSRYLYNVAGAAPLVEWTPESDTQNSLGAPRWVELGSRRFFNDAGSVQASTDDDSVVISLARLPPLEILSRLEGEDRRNVILTHARWELTSRVGVGAWFEEASGFDELRAIVAARLQEAPQDVVNLRLEQEAGPRNEVCERHMKQAASAADDPNWQYLAARCVADPVQKAQLFEELSRRFPDHGWLALAASGNGLDTKDFDRAIEQLKTAAATLPLLRDQVLARLVRLERARSDAATPFTDQQAQIPLLADIAVIEADSPPENHISPELDALRSLDRGQLQAAIERASGTGLSNTILVLAGASDGAPDELVEQALAAPIEADMMSSLYGAALALRRGRDPEPYLKRLEEIDAVMVADFREFLRHLRDEAAAERALLGTRLEVHAAAYAVAAIALGDECPPTWKTLAKRLLFPGERPYFR